MSKKKKRIYLVLLVGVLLLVAGMVICMNGQNFEEWQQLNTVREHDTLFEEEIREITLRKTVDVAEWVVFNDADLIAEWETFLSNLEVKRDDSFGKLGSDINGGVTVVGIKTNTKDFTVHFYDISGNQVIEIDEIFYLCKSMDDNPFAETYDMAMERHGTVTPWE